MLRYIVLLVLFLPWVHATTLGMNYYHESQMGKGGYYLFRNSSEEAEDFGLLENVSVRDLKVYMNPLVRENLNHTLGIANRANARGFRVVVAMNTEDRWLDDNNWQEYKDRVLEACARFQNTSYEFLVGNEVYLHSHWSSQEIRARVEPLMQECRQYQENVSYEEFYYARDAWKSYPGMIYLNLYEHLPSFTKNVGEAVNTWGDNLRIGEFGETTKGYQNIGFGEDWQAQNVAARWQVIRDSGVSIAYVFTLHEPSNDGFGLIYLNRTPKKAWNALIGRNGSVQAAASVVIQAATNSVTLGIPAQNQQISVLSPVPATNSQNTIINQSNQGFNQEVPRETNPWLEPVATVGFTGVAIYAVLLAFI